MNESLQVCDVESTHRLISGLQDGLCNAASQDDEDSTYLTQYSNYPTTKKDKRFDGLHWAVVDTTFEPSMRDPGHE